MTTINVSVAPDGALHTNHPLTHRHMQAGDCIRAMGAYAKRLTKHRGVIELFQGHVSEAYGRKGEPLDTITARPVGAFDPRRTRPAIVVHDSLVRTWIIRAYETFHGGPYHPSDSAPDSWEALKSWARGHRLGVDSLPVYRGGSEGTISGTERGNHLFRAWHDSLHLKHGLGFSYADELAVAALHAEELRTLRAPQSVINAVWCDTAGQVMHYFKHKAFVVDQRAFVEECLNCGIDYALKRNWG